MIVEQSKQIVAEVGKAFIGKNEIVEKVLMTIYAGGHVLLQDCPGVGKTTLALAFSRVLGLQQKRIQFTTDTMPSDITGFTVFNRETNRFEYQNGAADCQLLLADEINRTSPKTQAALLEAMEEGQVTVDGVTHPLPSPFFVLATQNPVGSAGTQNLPNSQLDRFLMRLSMGYPDRAQQVDILKNRRSGDPLDDVETVAQRDGLRAARERAEQVFVADSIYDYIAALAEATRAHPLVQLGVSPRAALALCRAAKASAFVAGRDFVLPEDVTALLESVWAHRLLLSSKARLDERSAQDILTEIRSQVPVPQLSERKK